MEIDSPEKDPYFYSPKTGHPQSPELDTIAHEGHELDSGVVVAPTGHAPEMAEAQEHPYELDATEQQRRSRMLSTISSRSGGSESRRPRHQREGSDGVVSAASPTSERPGHLRQGSDATELGTGPMSPLSPTSGGSGGVEGDGGPGQHQRQGSDGVVSLGSLPSPNSVLGVHGADEERGHRREQSAPVSLMSERRFSHL